MKSDSLRIGKLFQNGGDIHYELPLFQREYTWEKAQWQALLQDALAIHDEMASTGDPDSGKLPELEHFLGSVVVINDGSRNGTVPAFQVVDGQQRLTSMSLLLCSLASVLDKSQANLQRKIRRLLVNDDEPDDVKYKLLPTTKYGDRSAYMAVINGDEAIPATASRIPLAYEFFRKELAQRIASGAVIPDRLFQVLTQAFQVVFIDLNRDESPYRIFESLNAKGKPLSQADLVRNYIAMRLSPKGQEQVFDKHWSYIEDHLQERRSVGRSRLGELTAFLRHYLAMRTGVLCTEEHVYARFRDRAEREFVSEADFADEITNLRRFASYYEKFLRPETEASSKAKQVLRDLNILEASTVFPFLLAAYEAHETALITAAQWHEMLQVLENYLLRRYLADESSNFLNKVFPGLWASLDQADPVASLKSTLAAKNYPSDSRLRQRLSNRTLYDASALTRSRTTLVLEHVNRHLSAGTGGHTVLSGSATIEHILPQTPDDDWTDVLGPDKNRILDEVLHTLGNLTLVTQDWNSALSNKGFAIKRAKLANHALKLNSDYFGRDIDEWDESAIRDRANFLFDKIIEIWPSFGGDEETEVVTTEAASYHKDCVDRVALKLGQTFVKRGQTSFATSDDTIRLTCAVSKQYIRAGNAFYWYAIHPSQRAFLGGAKQSYVVYGCGSAAKTLLIPFDAFNPLVDDMNTTNKNDRQYWHVHISDVGGVMQLILAQGRKIDVTKYLLNGGVK
jgi:hypothetical protein